MKTYLAVDIGASSGRHILGWLEDGKLKLSEVYRFKNGAVPRDGHRCWDIDGLCKSVVKGIAKCAEDEETENPVSVNTFSRSMICPMMKNTIPMKVPMKCSAS